MKHPLLALALFCIAAPALHAQLDDTDPQYRALCRAALAKPFTPPPVDPALKSTCDSTVTYFGIGHPVDYQAALACAYAEYTHADAATFSPFPGAGILSMIYANGLGTAPSLDLATRFTCENFSAPSEIEARLDILSTDRETQALQPFDLCATASSANTLDWCTSIEARQSEVERNHDLAAFSAQLPPAALLPLQALMVAQKDFEDARIHNELDLNGASPTFVGFHLAEKTFSLAHAFHPATTPAASPAPPAPIAPLASEPSAFTTVPLTSQLEEQNDLGDRFLADLQLLTSPSFVEKTDPRKADRDMENSLKLARTGAPKHLQNTTITYKGIEDTQRRWNTLLDAWTAFIHAAQPSPARASQAVAYLTIERARQINQLNDSARDR